MASTPSRMPTSLPWRLTRTTGSRVQSIQPNRLPSWAGTTHLWACSRRKGQTVPLEGMAQQTNTWELWAQDPTPAIQELTLGLNLMPCSATLLHPRRVSASEDRLSKSYSSSRLCPWQPATKISTKVSTCVSNYLCRYHEVSLRTEAVACCPC